MRSLLTCITIALLLLVAGPATRADSIAVVPGAPLSNPSSPFDVSHAGNNYSLGAGTSFNPAGFDVRDLFGGQFDSYLPERGNVIFADEQPKGSIASVDVTLAAPVAINNFNLWLADDGLTGNRSTREFKLFAGATLIDDVTILDNSGSQSYTSVYGGSIIEISGSIAGAPVASSYTLQFVQNQNAGSVSGLRAMEFEANTAPLPPAALTTLALMATLAFAMIRTRVGLA